MSTSIEKSYLMHFRKLFANGSKGFKLNGEMPFHGDGVNLLCGGSGDGESEANQIAQWKDDNSVRAYLRRKFAHRFVYRAPRLGLPTGSALWMAIPNSMYRELRALLGVTLLAPNAFKPLSSVKDIEGGHLFVHTDAKWQIFPKTQRATEYVVYFTNEAEAVHAKLLVGEGQ